MTTLCALDAAAGTKFRHPVVYTYAAPRVGNPDFKRAYDGRIARSFRVCNRFDVVTHLPPTTLTIPKTDNTYYYQHVLRPEELSFHNGSVAGNHSISSYYAELAARDPLFAHQLSEHNPGFCPGVTLEF